MAMITLWKDTEKKTLDPLLFSREADRLALQIGNEDRNKNKGTQLRRFFDEILRLDSLAQTRDADWDLILPRVHMVVAKVAYARGRNLVTDTFVSLMRDGIDQEVRQVVQPCLGCGDIEHPDRRHRLMLHHGPIPQPTTTAYRSGRS